MFQSYQHQLLHKNVMAQVVNLQDAVHRQTVAPQIVHAAHLAAANQKNQWLAHLHPQAPQQVPPLFIEVFSNITHHAVFTVA